MNLVISTILVAYFQLNEKIVDIFSAISKLTADKSKQYTREIFNMLLFQNKEQKSSLSLNTKNLTQFWEQIIENIKRHLHDWLEILKKKILKESDLKIETKAEKFQKIKNKMEAIDKDKRKKFEKELAISRQKKQLYQLAQHFLFYAFYLLIMYLQFDLYKSWELHHSIKNKLINDEFSSSIFNNEKRTLGNILTIKELQDWLDQVYFPFIFKEYSQKLATEANLQDIQHAQSIAIEPKSRLLLRVSTPTSTTLNYAKNLKAFLKPQEQIQSSLELTEKDSLLHGFGSNRFIYSEVFEESIR